MPRPNLSTPSPAVQCLVLLRANCWQKLDLHPHGCSNLRHLAAMTVRGKRLLTYPTNEESESLHFERTSRGIVFSWYFSFSDMRVVASFSEDYEGPRNTVQRSEGQIDFYAPTTRLWDHSLPSFQFFLNQRFGRQFHIHRPNDLIRNGYRILPVREFLGSTQPMQAGPSFDEAACQPHTLFLKASLMAWVLRNPKAKRSKPWKAIFRGIKTSKTTSQIAAELVDGLAGLTEYVAQPDLHQPISRRLIDELRFRKPPLGGYRYAVDRLYRATLRVDELR